MAPQLFSLRLRRPTRLGHRKIMECYGTALLRKREVARSTTVFYFEKPHGFSHVAGQYVDIQLPSMIRQDDKGAVRSFSLVSAPHEKDLIIATRMRASAFKDTLNAMKEGGKFSFEGPYGSFILHENEKRPAIFLAGGIGITPFMSIIKDVLKRQLSYSLYLFYSNRTPEDAPFLSDLGEFQKEAKNFTFVPTMTGNATPSSWQGRQGYITEAMIREYVPPGSLPIYYSAGPQTMVAALRTLLTSSGVSPGDIMTEEFSGY